MLPNPWSIIKNTISRYRNGRPVLSPKSGTFYSRAAYNAAAVIKSGKAYLLFRAEEMRDNCTGRIGLAIETSPHSYNFCIHRDPVIFPQFDYEKFGCEDPRITKIGNTYLMTYTGHGKTKNGRQIARACLASSKDLIHWVKHGPIFKEKDWYIKGTKPGGIVAKKFDDCYILHFSGEDYRGKVSIGIAMSYGENFYKWKVAKSKNPLLTPQKGNFDSEGLEPGPAAIATRKGLLLIYNGWDTRRTHRPGLALFAKDNPTKSLWRSHESFAETETEWETQGMTHRGLPRKIIFTEGYVERDNKKEIYYGASDLYTCLFLAAH